MEFFTGDTLKNIPKPLMVNLTLYVYIEGQMKRW